MAQVSADLRRVMSLIKNPVSPLGPDVEELLRVYQPNIDAEYLAPAGGIADMVGLPIEVVNIIDAVKLTLDLFRSGTTSKAPELVDAGPALRRRLRDASKYLCDVIDVLDVLHVHNGDDQKTVRDCYDLLVEIADELHMSVFEVQARSVA